MTAETIPHWNPYAGEWQTLTVEMPDEPRRRRTRKRAPARRGQPRDLTGLSNSAPLPSWLRDTAYAPGEPLADMRSYLDTPAMRTHRTAVTLPADPGRITVTR